ncbi:acyl-CoA dehydrogenase family protein [Streptomyces sp. NPDC058534]|uniref:acyl-CoA dehydrogenase family protein n=1 Tax=Streptomyces sp. NPDC058534 TaxID=3346541 RepID=UPI003665B38F
MPVDAAGVRRAAAVTMDQARVQARIVLDGAEGRAIGAEGDGGRILRHVLDLACTALAAEQVGAAERCPELTVGHAMERIRSGRPVGSFQAVRHRPADAYVLVESVRSVDDVAARRSRNRPPSCSRHRHVHHRRRTGGSGVRKRAGLYERFRSNSSTSASIASARSRSAA